MRHFEWPEGVDYDTLVDAVAVTTNSLCRRYGRYGVTSDDVRQELWIWLMGKTEWLTEWLTRDDPDGQRQGYAALTLSLRRAGERYCRKEKAAILGYETRDEYFYDEAAIKNWLAVRVQGVGVMTNSEYTGRVKISRAANEGWNVEATVADLERALAVLEPEQRWLVNELYGEGTDLKLVARDLGVSRQAIEQRAQRAIRKMIDHLGGKSPW